MRVIVAGSRDFNNYEYLKEILDNVHKVYNITEIVSGCAKGADTLGEQWATQRKIRIKKYPADWATFGKSAGYRRNLEMAEYADALVAFWDGSSKGTMHMISLARGRKLKVKVVKYLLDIQNTSIV